ncbi:hypothetical protein HPB47_027658 [Ixodes persulcatus]|uniref:Uncharacterized protein n=1 Tax=Ixodes persulcatus TaxID=34615 RepID=A0AC60PVL8_IXOPE|nr:hypothetical protein HPB47_027658 [Ixodes persulcatus]
MILGDGVGPDKLPHQGNIDGTKVLFSVPGRPSLCLRCEKVGHMRRQCVAPWCRVCRGFGHEPEQCTRSYADMTRRATRPEHFGEQLDDADMEELETHAVSLPNVVENVDDQPCGASEGDKVTIGEAAAAAAGEATAPPAPVAIEPEETGEATNPSIPPTLLTENRNASPRTRQPRTAKGGGRSQRKRKTTRKKQPRHRRKNGEQNEVEGEEKRRPLSTRRSPLSRRRPSPKLFLSFYSPPPPN